MTTESGDREREIAAQARRLFADSVAGLDGQTRSRLARARAAAVAAAGERRADAWLAPSRFVPLGAAAAALLAIALIWQAAVPPVAPATPAVVADLDLLLEGEDLELFGDLEFYAWLLEQPELLEAGESGDGSG